MYQRGAREEGTAYSALLYDIYMAAIVLGKLTASNFRVDIFIP